MGLGDEIMATGYARGMAARGKRMAFGVPHAPKIEWTHLSPQIFKDNPNIAPPGSETARDLIWHPFRRGNRLYNMHHQVENRWVWNYQFRPPIGEIFLSPQEIELGERSGKGFVLIEPNVARYKASAPNKAWSLLRWNKVARRLMEAGHRVIQLDYSGAIYKLNNVPLVATPTFREAMAIVRNAHVVVTTEGGLHHAAAAFGRRAVVMFGAWIPPTVTGYSFHENIALGGPKSYCGSLTVCQHCIDALNAISVDQVAEACERQLAQPFEVDTSSHVASPTN